MHYFCKLVSKMNAFKTTMSRICFHYSRLHSIFPETGKEKKMKQDWQNVDHFFGNWVMDTESSLFCSIFVYAWKFP